MYLTETNRGSWEGNRILGVTYLREVGRCLLTGFDLKTKRIWKFAIPNLE